MPARFLIVSRFSVHPGKSTDFIAALGHDTDRRVFKAVDHDEVIEIQAIADEANLDEMAARLNTVSAEYADYLMADIRRELLDYVEAPKSTEGLLPDTPYIQLRHVEVKPAQMSAYRDWRDNTIFDVVRNSDQVEVFLAYHSVLSGQPGVMFIAGFSGAIDEYAAVFNTDRYKKIVREAGDQYITGGTDGLYTQIYQDPTEAVAA